MPITMNPGTFYPSRVNEYVPAMAYSADVNDRGETRIDFGTPALASATAIITTQTIASAGSLEASSLNLSTIVEPWGRNLQTVADGAATSKVTVHGWDYLGQPMSEQFTLNGTTAVAGVKAFKKLRQVVWESTSSRSITLGTGTAFGLPYKAIKAEFETTDGTLASAGTLNAASLTDPQTITTADPRGTYIPTTTPNGSKRLTAGISFIADVNSSNNGGLMGLPHYSA